MKNNNAKKWITLLVLCAGGGIIYRLPYLREVFYIPMQQAFHLTNFQMGFLTSMYGIVNFLLYIHGGVIAYKFYYKIFSYSHRAFRILVCNNTIIHSMFNHKWSLGNNNSIYILANYG